MLNTSSTTVTAAKPAVLVEEMVVNMGVLILRYLAASTRKEVGWSSGSGGGMFNYRNLKGKIINCRRRCAKKVFAAQPIALQICPAQPMREREFAAMGRQDGLTNENEVLI